MKKWHKHHSWYFKIISNFTRLTAREISYMYNNLELSLVVFIPNITTNHAITYINSTVFSFPLSSVVIVLYSFSFLFSFFFFKNQTVSFQLKQIQLCFWSAPYVLISAYFIAWFRSSLIFELQQICSKYRKQMTV